MPRRTFRPYGHDQTFLLPLSSREWLPADLDLTPIPATYGGVTRGTVPSDPRRRVAASLCQGERGAGVAADRPQVARGPRLPALATNSAPDFQTISDFPSQHLDSPRDLCVPALLLCQRVRRTLRTTRGRRLIAKRVSTGEPVFGQIKHGHGFRQFLSRGHRTVHGEWALSCTTHNVLMLRTPRRRRPGAPDLQSVSVVKSATREKDNPWPSMRELAVRKGKHDADFSISDRLLARIIHEHFCCNRGFATATGLRRAGSPLAPSTYCSSTPRGLAAPHARLAPPPFPPPCYGGGKGGGRRTVMNNVG